MKIKYNIIMIFFILLSTFLESKKITKKENVIKKNNYYFRNHQNSIIEFSTFVYPNGRLLIRGDEIYGISTTYYDPKKKIQIHYRIEEKDVINKDTINSFFLYNSVISDFANVYYSFILHLFKAPLLTTYSDSIVIRIIKQVENNNYKIVTYHFQDSSSLIEGVLGKFNGDFIILKENLVEMTNKTTRRFIKNISKINWTEIDRDCLFSLNCYAYFMEVKWGDNYYIFDVPSEKFSSCFEVPTSPEDPCYGKETEIKKLHNLYDYLNTFIREQQ